MPPVLRPRADVSLDEERELAASVAALRAALPSGSAVLHAALETLVRFAERGLGRGVEAPPPVATLRAGQPDAQPSRILLAAPRDAGADAPPVTTLLSTLAAAHSSGAGLLGFFSTAEAAVLRLVNVEFRDAVAAFPWTDAATRIASRLGGWRASFPRARAANISVEWSNPQKHNGFVDADFVHLAGVKTLNMSECSQAGITDSAFVHLKGIHTLDISKCEQAGITDVSFSHLEGIHTLNMSWCSQAGITDAAFVHLKGIHTLNMSGCDQAGITDAAIAHLEGIHTLNMSFCDQAGITDAAFAHLKGVHSLDMSYCQQAGITDAAFAHLKGVHSLDMSYCYQAGITEAIVPHLRGIRSLNVGGHGGLLADAARGVVLKPLRGAAGAAEAAFYARAPPLLPAGLAPACFGTVALAAAPLGGAESGDGGRGARAAAAGRGPHARDSAAGRRADDAAAAAPGAAAPPTHLVLEDVTRRFTRPCVMDVKMGARATGDDAPPSKAAAEAAKWPAQAALGLRPTGSRAWDARAGRYREPRGRAWMLAHDERSVVDAFVDFLPPADNDGDGDGDGDDKSNDGGGGDEAGAGGGGGGGGARARGRRGGARAAAGAALLRALEPVESFFVRQSAVRFHGSSLLLIYEGCPPPPPPLRAGAADGAPGDDDARPPAAAARMIDFAHVWPLSDGERRDEGYLLGLATLRRLIARAAGLDEPGPPPEGGGGREGDVLTASGGAARRGAARVSRPPACVRASEITREC